MNFFKDSDKKKFNFEPNSFELNLSDPGQDLKGFRIEEGLIFGRFSKEDILNMLENSNVLSKLVERGYPNYILETNFLSYLDNRIFIKNENGQVLVHLRLKMDNFEFSKIQRSLKMIYIDWLLTQNLKMGKLEGKKKLFDGQEYPGLNIFKEMTRFILGMSRDLGAHGIFNVPEYFHDAVLFHKNFKFLDPRKEGNFRALIQSFKKYSLHVLSGLIHQNRIYDEVEGKTYNWKHGEMFYTESIEIHDMIFDKKYFEEVEHSKHKSKMKVLGLLDDTNNP
jgi:hypothetical protein